MRGKRTAAGKRGWRCDFYRVVRWTVLLAGAFYASCTLGLLYVRFLPPPITAIELQRCIEGRGRVDSSRVDVPLSAVSPHLWHAVVAAEDTRFFAHHGIDWQGVREAVEQNWRRRRFWRGGSTITQQLVKNLFFGTRGGLLRKALEVPLTFLAELILPKRRILELYLNVVEWGPGVYGAEAAARHHYGRSAAALGRDEAARLAACLPAPLKRQPAEMRRTARMIERRMAALGW